MKPWTHALKTKPIKYRSAEYGAHQVSQMYKMRGEAVDGAISVGAVPAEALEQGARAITDVWLRNGFIEIYKKIRPEHFAPVAGKE